MTRGRKILLTMLALVGLAGVGFAAPTSAMAEVGTVHAQAAHPGRAANMVLSQAKGRGQAASPQLDGCVGHTQVVPNGSWASVTASAYPIDCSGVVACYSTVDLQTESKLTNGWSTVADGSQHEGCSESGASIVTEPCGKASFSWSYRAVGYFTIFFVNGGSTSGSEVTSAISNNYLCGPGE